MSPNFYTQPDKDVYHMIQYVEFDEEHNILSRSSEFSLLLQNENYLHELYDCLEYGLEKACLRKTEQYGSHNFVLYRKYSRKDVCKLLNWKKNITPQNISGYFIGEDNGEMTCPIFVTYEKKDDIAETTKYEDVFINNSLFSWMSRSRRTSKSTEVATIINQPNNNIKVLLFVKKNDAEGTDFYYLGEMNYNSYYDTKMKSGESVVNIRFNMETAVPQNLYDYLEG